MLAAVTASITTAILLYHLPMMYLMEAANRRHVYPTDDEWLNLFGLVRWTQALIPSIWLSIFTSKFSLLVSFYRMSSHQSKTFRYFFWGVTASTILCWIFQSSYVAFACPRVDEEARKCTAFANGIKQDLANLIALSRMPDHVSHESTRRTIQHIHGLYVWQPRPLLRHFTYVWFCSTITLTDLYLVLTIASSLYNCPLIRPIPKRTLASMFILCLTKMTMGVLRVGVTDGYMGYGYTWSLYWQTLEAFILLVLESFLVIRSVFVPRQKAEAEYIDLL
jgi:hypothetical protein